jgi:N-carbamoylputrescine amidase
VVVADLNLNMIDEVRATWQFFRDRRPDAYGPLVHITNIKGVDPGPFPCCL